MPSPFPGMNPYLEQADVWTDFHQSFIVLLRDSLRAQIDPRYIVKIEEQLYIHEPPAEAGRLMGKVDLSLTPGAAGAPAQIELLDVDVERLSRVEIRERASRQLLTAVELLSPTKKYAGPHREQYLSKRRHLQASPVHFVEIDLLRGGPRMPALNLPQCDYCVVVSRSEDRPRADFWPVRLRDPLPAIPVPLRAPDPDARLELQPLLHRCYDSAGYQTYICDGTPSPGLSTEDAAWAEQLLRPLRPSGNSGNSSQ